MIDIAKLAAGPELDMLISEKIFGFQAGPCSGELEETDGGLVCLRCHHAQGWNERDGTAHDFSPKPYSTSIHSAWDVLDHLNAKNGYVKLVREKPGGEWWIQWRQPGQEDGFLWAKTAPIAICQAALKAAEKRS